MCPIYEYACDACGQLKEVLHKMDEVVEVKCEGCSTEILMHRIISAAGFVLNGAGFYQNDYKTKSKGGDE